MRIWLRSVSLWVLVVALSAPGWVSAQRTEKSKEPSLAELARKERERRANFKEGIRIITNANIQEVKGLVSVAAVPPPPEAEGTEEEGEQEGMAETEKRDESEWASLFEEARLNLKSAVNRGDVLQLKMNDLRNSYFNENDGSTQARIQQQLQETQQQIDANRQEVQTAREALSVLERDAAAEGVSKEKVRDLAGEAPQTESIRTSPDS